MRQPFNLRELWQYLLIIAILLHTSVSCVIPLGPPQLNMCSLFWFFAMLQWAIMASSQSHLVIHNLRWSSTRSFLPEISIAHEAVLLKTPWVHSISHTKFAPVWVSIKVNFDPIQGSWAKSRWWMLLWKWALFCKTTNFQEVHSLN